MLKAAADEGYLDTEAIFVDGTHIKANANLKKQARKAVPKEAKRYAHELFDEINKDREAHGKKPFDDDNDGNTTGGNSNEPEMVEKTVPTTDPECGVFHKGEHKKVFTYEAHTACDKHNFILGVHVTPGNVHDSVAFDSLYDDICKHYPEHKIVAADSAYKTPWICKRIFESGRILTSAYTRPKTKAGNHPWYTYVYDEYFDDVICPEYKVLHYSTTNRNGYREYKSRPYLCKDCPTRAMCTQNAKYEKTVSRHIWQRFVEMAEDVRHTPIYRDIYKLRQQKIERVFADAKEKKVTKPMKGHFTKAGVAAKKYVKEFKLEDAANYEVGAEIKADVFAAGDKVDASGVSKGKGFQSTIKRYNASRGPMGHGSKSHRVVGSMGSSAYPSRVKKGKRMPGHMGSANVTIQNLEIVRADAEKNLLLIKGAVPGPKGSVLVIKDSVKA